VPGEGGRPERGRRGRGADGAPAPFRAAGLTGALSSRGPDVKKSSPTMDFIDEQGYRANVGIILTDGAGQVLLAGRRGRGGWQFPQGGIRPEEDTESAMFRELREEVGLEPRDVTLVGATSGWLRYRLPERYI